MNNFKNRLTVAKFDVTFIKENTENVAIAVHCNLRPSDAEPVILRLITETERHMCQLVSSRSTYPFVSCSVFTANPTLRCDLDL